MPINLAAMFFVLVAHVFLAMAIIATLWSFVAILALFVVGVGLVAHYANVVEEIALEERDELPRFLRHFSFGEDIWFPFINVFLAWMICFGPGVIVWATGTLMHWRADRVMLIAVAWDVIGLMFFPAVVLTTITSGSLTNLRPDRLLGTIARIGPRYVLLAIVYTAAIMVYYEGVNGTIANFIKVFTGGVSFRWFIDGLIAYGSLILGIYLMHYFAWIMGLCYRAGHNEFPWVFQRRSRLIPGVNAPRHAPIRKTPLDKHPIQ